MEVATAVEIALTMLSLGAAVSAAAWARTVVIEAQQLRAEMLESIGNLRHEVAVRRVIRTLDEVPPELIGPQAREVLDETIRATGVDAAKIVQAAIELGVLYSEINRGRNEALGIDEDETPSSEDDDDEPPSSEPEPK